MVKLLPADAVAAEALADAFNASFADYLLPFAPLDAGGWRAFVQRQGADLPLGRVALRGDEVVAFVLVTPRTASRSRIAVMGARPTERGSGVAAALLDEVIAAARERGEGSVELEVFAQNERALALYRARGFEPVCALYGYVSDAGGIGPRHPPTDEVSREEALRWLDEVERGDPGRWPWQVTGPALAVAHAELSCRRSAGAQLVFSAAGDGAVAVVSLIDRDPAQHGALALLTALRAEHPRRALRAPQLQRDDGPALAFDAAGWTRLPLHQLLLRLRLGAPGLIRQSPP